MLSLALRGLAQRKLRSSLTALAIMLGVAMISGTLVLSDSVNKSFDDIFAEASAGIDVSVRAKIEVEGGFELPEAGTALPESLLAEVEAIEGVEQASGAIGDATSIAILNDEGDRIGPPQGGPPHIVNSIQPEPFSPFTYIEGRQPEAEDEVAIDSFTAEEEGYEIGQLVPITGAEGLREYTLAGIARFGSGVPLGGATLAEFTLAEAQRITGKRGEFDEIAIEAAEGIAAEQLRDAVTAALADDGLSIKTGDEIASDDADDIKSGFSFFTTALLVFAGIAVFVGAFLIFNTFSITVAQRTREFGMLRTLGASSRQVLAAVVLEAFVLGILASIVGVVGGLGFVKLLLTIFEALGFELPQSGLPLEPRTVVVALIVGVIATVASAAIPALRATRVTPLEALSEGIETGEGAHGRRRSVVAALLVLVGIGLILLGLFSGGEFAQALGTMGFGLVLLFIGIAMLGGRIIAPLASVVGRPIERLRGVTGRLARENTLRNPGRTATTSSALMIGVALVVFVLMLGSAITKSVEDALDKTFTGDLAVYNVDGFSPISADVAPELVAIEGVRTASPIAAAGGRIGKDESFITGLDAATLPAVGELDWVEGSNATLAALGERGAIVESQWAEDNGVAVGDEIEITTPSGETAEVAVEGSIRDRISLLVESVALPIELLREEFDVRQDFFILVGFEDGADFDATRTLVDDELAATFPNVEARSQQQLRDENREQIQGLLYLIYALLTMSVLLSLVGVVNTLVLTVFERTRELGMLRAIGASRSQIRRMVRYESVITALIGAIIGAAIGVAVAVAAVEALESEGLVLGFPVGGIVLVLVLAGIAGVLAGIFPARRAAKIEVMEALAYE